MTCKDASSFPPHSRHFTSQAKQMTCITVDQPTSTNLARIVSKEILNFYINLDMLLFFNTLTKRVFHHYFDILRNNSNKFYSVTKEKNLQSFTFNRPAFFPLPDLEAQYPTTFFGHYISACNTVFSLCLPLKINSYFSLNSVSGQESPNSTIAPLAEQVTVFAQLLLSYLLSHTNPECMLLGPSHLLTTFLKI